MAARSARDHPSPRSGIYRAKLWLRTLLIGSAFGMLGLLMPAVRAPRCTRASEPALARIADLKNSQHQILGHRGRDLIEIVVSSSAENDCLSIRHEVLPARLTGLNVDFELSATIFIQGAIEVAHDEILELPARDRGRRLRSDGTPEDGFYQLLQR
jgi:hypothetical protein